MLYFLKMIAENCNNLQEFINRLNNIKSLCYSSQSNQGITLSTVHSAKGLEFSRVYIVDLIDGEFPNNTSIEKLLDQNFELMEEERRLFYVGMSRAKIDLTLITVKNINGKNSSSSRFLNELIKND